LRRVPIRLRLTLVFSGIMAIVLAATGAVLYLRFAADFDSTIDGSLRSRAADVAALVKEADSGLSEGRLSNQESFAEVLDGRARVLDSTPLLKGRALLSRSELRRAQQGPVFFDHQAGAGLRDESRLYAVPVDARGRRLVAVVGSSIAARTESLSDLRQLLFIGGPIALALASLAAYWVAAAALRPVEAMRARAAGISSAGPGLRLPVPPSKDEVARLGETLNAMLERLAEASEHERAFVADASHELRTPLAILKTELELALQGGRSPEELHAALASAAEETDRLTQLAEDLLTIAQTDRGELPIRPERAPVAEIMGDVASRFSRRAEDAGRPLDIEMEPDLRLEADRLRLDQALGNMLDNALRYGSGPVSLTARARDGLIELHVLDRGPGLPEEFRERAFERFSRASASRNDGGSGLGLAIVEAIAHAHGGEAHLANRPGGGADVWITLPGVLS
jgi:signal transduction histidine kinase